MIFFVDGLDFDHKPPVLASPAAFWPIQSGVISAGGHLQNPAHTLDLESAAMILYKLKLHLGIREKMPMAFLCGPLSRHYSVVDHFPIRAFCA